MLRILCFALLLIVSECQRCDKQELISKAEGLSDTINALKAFINGVSESTTLTDALRAELVTISYPLLTESIYQSNRMLQEVYTTVQPERKGKAGENHTDFEALLNWRVVQSQAKLANQAETLLDKILVLEKKKEVGFGSLRIYEEQSLYPKTMFRIKPQAKELCYFNSITFNDLSRRFVYYEYNIDDREFRHHADILFWRCESFKIKFNSENQILNLTLVVAGKEAKFIKMNDDGMIVLSEHKPENEHFVLKAKPNRIELWDLMYSQDGTEYNLNNINGMLCKCDKSITVRMFDTNEETSCDEHPIVITGETCDLQVGLKGDGIGFVVGGDMTFYDPMLQFEKY